MRAFLATFVLCLLAACHAVPAMARQHPANARVPCMDAPLVCLMAQQTLPFAQRMPGPTLGGGMGRLAGVRMELAAKVEEIVSACGSRVISAVRHTYVAGTRRVSLHAFGKAVDVQGNPSCIYARLGGWQGGYSVDYGQVRHVHISYEPGGREWGARFVHGGHRHRYAQRGRRA